ncbi:hypothetical protein PVK06_034018 [Gossypium arboreum]|uniref:Uncharacterized protein n=1 Tax=Gossypium arboreum TaxID=29729 RepID=A0ABR0ND00_GOSAR|nr:hypothetical protein PVK06_034018 [Gossypium arboreum]
MRAYLLPKIKSLLWMRMKSLVRKNKIIIMMMKLKMKMKLLFLKRKFKKKVLNL